MGCCEGIPSPPREIIPDPTEDESCMFAIAPVGTLSPDYIAYHGPEAHIEARKWFYINKEGSFFSGDCQIVLENFRRLPDAEDPNKGEVLWTVRFDATPDFERFFKSPKSLDASDVFACLGDFDAVDEDDEFYFRQYLGGRPEEFRRIMKWRMRTCATLLPGTRSGPRVILEVFASGTGICYYQQLPNADAELEWTTDTTEFVDRVRYRVSRGNEEMASWTVEGQGAKGEFTTKTSMFDMTMTGGWANPTPVVESVGAYDPTLVLMLAYMCAFEFSPSAIKVDLDCKFPQSPFDWGAGGW
eukprot:TRINITY_DN47076_c0_g1_i1.p1 TRINITY_DN47076_c0_g1~~TRINITY_DN47076_c0_g1_i1.p1  ORF type:complete len:300 (-),score=38.35 TRINITY_DN47076_c0_g1_i1:146-1045(-)